MSRCEVRGQRCEAAVWGFKFRDESKLKANLEPGEEKEKIYNEYY